MRRARKEAITVDLVSGVPGQPRGNEVTNLFTSNTLIDTDGRKIDLNRLPCFIDQAKETLAKDAEGKSFCNEMLRIEISGPNQSHLSLIDLPGLFYVLKRRQNKDRDAPRRVRETVERYMKEERSIILAVVSAKDDFANQEILKLVRRINGFRQRTLGVITGVDLIPEGSARESEYVELAQNKLFQLDLGWHAVRNLSFEDRKSSRSDRNFLEYDFLAKQQAWAPIPETDLGAPRLKIKLSRTLLKHVGKELGGVITALNNKITDNEKILSKLGHQRFTVFEKRLYLTEIGARHQTLVQAAMNGTYHASTASYDDFFADHSHNLRARIREELDAFQNRMSTGHRWELQTSLDIPLTPEDTPCIGQKQHLDQRDEFIPYQVGGQNYLTKVDLVLRQYRGQELHNHFDHRLVAVLFKDQSCRWQHIARTAVEKMVDLVRDFLEHATSQMVESRRARLLFESKILPAIRLREQKLSTKLEELTRPFQESLPRTSNPLYVQSHASWKRKIQESQARRAMLKFPDLKNPDACEGLVTSLLAYYPIAQATFVDNVIDLGVELCLLGGLAEIIAPATITSMTDEEVNALASEFPEDATERDRAETALRNLRAGRDICREYRQNDFSQPHDSGREEPSKDSSLLKATTRDLFGAPARRSRSSSLSSDSATSDQPSVSSPATSHTFSPQKTAEKDYSDFDL